MQQIIQKDGKKKEQEKDIPPIHNTQNTSQDKGQKGNSTLFLINPLNYKNCHY